VREIVVEIATPEPLYRMVEGLAGVAVEKAADGTPRPGTEWWVLRDHTISRNGVDWLGVRIEGQGLGRVVVRRWVHPNEAGEWVERPAAPHADPNDPIWWGGSPRPTGVMELIVEAANYLAFVIGNQGWGTVLSKRRL
jgi:hypothetical protein